MKKIHSNVIGIDIGSVSISVAEVDIERRIIHSSYECHHGDIYGCLDAILTNYDLPRIRGIAATTSTPSSIIADRRYDNRVAVMTAVQRHHGKTAAILLVGGEKFGLILFDKNGGYLNYKTNTSCAAGTGSFLDQQARRLGLAGIDELSSIAYGNTGGIPKIASRCAVFAKTDLVHAQQEGYTLPEICDGLCHGLARNIHDTLFSVEKPAGPVFFTGGVSRNRAVVRHISAMLGQDVITGEHCIHEAAGAAMCLLDDADTLTLTRPASLKDIIEIRKNGQKYFHPALAVEKSEYPDFSQGSRYEYRHPNSDILHPVEVDIYSEPEPGGTCRAYLGVDIGSTSTKAVLLSPSKTVLAGFYTRTAGRPVRAVQNLLAAIDDLSQKTGTRLTIAGAGTTGSGRKMAGGIIGADTIIDEITAHARAACELNPDVDTIIEIGGQDSKFTTLKNGMVTFSVMNNVCAAGTGSFIEELAYRLGCGLEDISERTMNRRAPISSDRCTVFMERDINYFLREGCSVDEALASVLHSVIENYLTKVANEKNIGETVYFQGATAKNKALVAAFEQRLGKPIHVSRYCHLTGALGTALFLADQAPAETAFRGVGLYRKTIPIRSEVCGLCTNHCKITTADLDGEKVAFGFLCGRDYGTQKRVDVNPSGFDLMAERKKAAAFTRKGTRKTTAAIGLPAALHMMDDLPLWQKFFDELGFRTITSNRYAEAVKEGKKHAGAEFCAPMIAWHGHVRHLLDKADYVFLPFYLERRTPDKEIRRQYCYYTQFSVPLASGIDDGAASSRFITPLVHYLYNAFFTRVQLYRSLKAVDEGISYFEVSEAFSRAQEYVQEYNEKLKSVYAREAADSSDIHVVLLGRPYTVLSEYMNKGITRIFANLGIKAFFQDMLAHDEKDCGGLRPLLDEVHWHYSAKILEAANIVAGTPGAYPVFVTSFKCTPDSFNLNYFRKIMDANGKPYLVLQLDDHDSSVGYETRIEAAVRSFRNHHQSRAPQVRPDYSGPLTPARETRLFDKTVFLPNWDNITLGLMAANLKRIGLDARLLKPSETSLQKGLRHNTGQCIPLNIIAQEFIDNVRKDGLDPARSVLWIPEAKLACNIALFACHIKTLLDAHGQGMEKAGVYVGELSFIDVSVRLPFNTYFAILFGGLLRKMGCKVRPYEINKGETDRAIEKGTAILADAFLGKRTRESAVTECTALFERIETRREYRPKVAIFGDLYVRDNEVMNQDLIHFIEENGGEVITTPYTHYMQMIAGSYQRKWLIEGNYKAALSSEAILLTLNRLERNYYRIFERVLKEPMPVFTEPPKKILAEYNMRMENTGESMDNILKIFYLLREHPDISLFVQTNPAFCCPSLVTEAMSRDIERRTGVPVVSITYDGTGGGKNDALVPYLKFARHTRPAPEDFDVRENAV